MLVAVQTGSWAGAGKDIAYGSDHSDITIGGVGRDLVWGGFGDDRSFGGPGGDVVGGNTGIDSLVGGPGADVCFAMPLGRGQEDTRGCESVPQPPPGRLATAPSETTTLREGD